MTNVETILKRFDSPDEVRTFEKGTFEIVRLGGMTIGRATYQPGWKWSVHVGPTVSASRCNVEHVGLVLSGRATAAIDGGAIHELIPGTLFYIPPGPPGHDSWVIGDEPYVSSISSAPRTTPTNSTCSKMGGNDARNDAHAQNHLLPPGRKG